MLKTRSTLSPVITAAMFAVLLAACSPAPQGTDTGMTQSSAPAMMQSSAAAMDSSTAAMSDGYADGTYTAEGTYKSPAGQETVHVTLVLKDDVITSATFKGDATNARSIQMQGAFATGFEEAVVGKDIDTLSLSVVNGSSLTPGGFMNAVAKIKAEAKA